MIDGPAILLKASIPISKSTLPINAISLSRSPGHGFRGSGVFDTLDTLEAVAKQALLELKKVG